MSGQSVYPQQVDAPLTRHSTFLVCTVDAGASSVAAVRAALSGISDLLKTVGFRDRRAKLSCVTGVGSDVWTRLMHSPRPVELRPFQTVVGATHTAVSTAGDLLFHIRSDRQDLNFEFERLLLDALGDAVSVVDEVHGFRYFDSRDLLGFVDGTANPVGQDLPEATLVGDEDPAAAGGSYVVVQRYTHPLDAWNALTTEQQEAIIGRRKADDVELDDAPAPDQKAHKTLATIVDDDGEHDIVRDNMPFGSPAAGEFGTYFIGYSRHLWVIERMLERMFIGDPPGLHDRLLDFSTARTGGAFFAPALPVLDALADEPAADAVPSTGAQSEPGTAPDDRRDGSGADDHSLRLGSLRSHRRDHHPRERQPS